MRTSKVLLGALAVITGLLVGIGSPKEVRAANVGKRADASGVVKASAIKSDPNYNNGDCIVTLLPYSGSSSVTLDLDTDLKMKHLRSAEEEGSSAKKVDLIIKGNGKLTVTADGNIIGIFFKNLTVENAVISVTSNTSAIMSDMNGNISIKGGTVTAKGDYGLHAVGNVTISNNATVTATGVKRGIFAAGNMTVENSTVTVTATGDECGISSQRGITITDSTVKATGFTRGIEADENMIIENSSVTATGTGEFGFGISSKTGITITDSTVTSTGGTGGHGIFTTNNPIKISGSSSVIKAAGGEGAILADGNKITISDSLKVVKPEGGGLSADKAYIATVAGGQDHAKDVEIRSEEEETYNVTVEYNKEQGSAKADPESDVEKGKTVKLTATPADGCEFVEWTSSDVTIDNATSADKASLTMPGKNVTVKAVFKKKGDPDPEPSKKVVINSDEELTLDEKFGMEYSLCDENGKNFKNVKISKFEISGDIPDGLEIVQVTNDNGDCYQIKGTPTKAGTYKFTVTITFTSDEYPDGAEVVDNITITVSEKRDRKYHVRPHHDDGDHEDNTPAAVVNPNSITCYYIVNGVIDPKALFGKQEQGPACKASFTASLPKGWTEAFSFSMSYEGANTTTLKNGTLQLYIPGQYQKAGRQYAVMAMDKYGVVHIYQDTDALPFVFTSPLNFEGYAFNLIYKD